MAAVVAAAALSVTVIDATTVCSPAAIIALRVVGRGVTNICTTGVSVLVTVLVTVHAAALPASPAVTVTAAPAPELVTVDVDATSSFTDVVCTDVSAVSDIEVASDAAVPSLSERVTCADSAAGRGVDVRGCGCTCDVVAAVRAVACASGDGVAGLEGDLEPTLNCDGLAKVDATRLLHWRGGVSCPFLALRQRQVPLMDS